MQPTKDGTKTFYVCQCFFTDNIFLKKLEMHVRFRDRDQFLKEYKKDLHKLGCRTDEQIAEVISEIKAEVLRRENLGKDFLLRKKLISEKYQRLHPEVFKLKEEYLDSKFLDLVAFSKTDNASFEELTKLLECHQAERVYSFPVFTEEFCRLFIEELEHFESTDCPKGRPNTMNSYGILLNELGFDEGFLNPLREVFLTPLCTLLFPDWGGDSLDSHKAFVVTYRLGQDVDLSCHFDNAEITLNVALGKQFSGGALYLYGMKGKGGTSVPRTEYQHQTTVGLLHRGQHMHGAEAIAEGERHNLIIWMRSSSIRNHHCPMCNRPPTLEESTGFGDGFTVESRDVCASF